MYTHISKIPDIHNHKMSNADKFYNTIQLLQLVQFTELVKV